MSPKMQQVTILALGVASLVAAYVVPQGHTTFLLASGTFFGWAGLDKPGAPSIDALHKTLSSVETLLVAMIGGRSAISEQPPTGSETGEKP